MSEVTESSFQETKDLPDDLIIGELGPRDSTVSGQLSYASLMMPTVLDITLP